MQFIQNPYAQLHHVGEIKSVALTFCTTVAIVLLDGQFWKKDAVIIHSILEPTTF